MDQNGEPLPGKARTALTMMTSKMFAALGPWAAKSVPAWAWASATECSFVRRRCFATFLSGALRWGVFRNACFLSVNICSVVRSDPPAGAVDSFPPCVGRRKACRGHFHGACSPGATRRSPTARQMRGTGNRSLGFRTTLASLWRTSSSSNALTSRPEDIQWAR